MTYLQPHSYRPHQRTRRAIIILAATIVIVAGGIAYFVPHFFPGLFMTFAQPYWRSEFSLSAGTLDSPAALLAKNEELQRQLDADNVRLATISATEQENAELKALMGRASSTPRILAAVLAHPSPGSLYDEFIIDAGTDHGFAVGNRVYGSGDVLIGEITRVLDTSSTVTLFSSPGKKYDVQIGTEHFAGASEGLGGGQYRALLPRNANVHEGDFVTVPSLSDKPFGIIAGINSDPAEPFETVIFAPPLNIYSLRWVLVDTRHPAK